MPSAYTDVSGLRVGTTATLPATNELKVDMHKKLMTSYAQLTPLTTILTRIASTPAFNFRVDWTEKNEIPTQLIVATSESGTFTAPVIMNNWEALVNHTLLYNPRNDDLRILTATPSSTTLTVVADQGGKTSTNWNAGDVLFVLPPAIPENYATIVGASVPDSNVYNYVQLAKLQYQISRLQDKMHTHFGGAGSKRKELKMQKYRQYRINKEHLLYFGGRGTINSTAITAQYMAGGFNHYLRSGTLYKDFNGIMTESGYRNYIGDFKDQNPDVTEVWHFAAGNVIDKITDFGADKVRLSPMSKKYGLNIQEYISRGINVHLVALPLLDQSNSATRGWGWLLDLTRVTLKTVDPDAFYPDAQTVGESELITDTYRGVYTMMVANESRHSMHVGALL